MPRAKTKTKKKTKRKTKKKTVKKKRPKKIQSATNSQMMRMVGRNLAGSYYDFQATRISFSNRMRDIIWRKNEGIPFDKKIEKGDKKTFDDKYNDGNIIELLEDMSVNGRLTLKEKEYLSRIYPMIQKQRALENSMKKEMMVYVESEQIYQTFLSKIKGLGPVLSANLIKWLGYCENFETVSKLWAYSGFSPGQRRQKGETLNFNPQMKVLGWKISDSIIKQNTPYYRKLYDIQKKKQAEKLYTVSLDETHKIKGDLLAEKIGKMKVGTKIKNTNFNKLVKECEKLGKDSVEMSLSKGHIDARARRYIVKRFLQHYWVCARDLMKLPTGKPYIIGKGRHKHYESWEDAVKANETARMP